MTQIVQTSTITIRQISVSAMDNNVYLLTHKTSGEQILIDAADDIAAIKELLIDARSDAHKTVLKLIVTTHQHYDHIRALPQLAASTGAKTAAGREDIAGIKDQCGVDIDVPLLNGDEVAVAGITLSVIALRGHTPGSVALVYSEEGEPVHIFTGDSLFPGGVGNTDSDPQRFTSLLGDVITRIFDVYDDETIVHPGHGKATTLGVERPNLDDWRERGW